MSPKLTVKVKRNDPKSLYASVHKLANNEKPGDMFKEKNGETGWELGKKKRITVTEFRGTKYVNIREYYEKDGKVNSSIDEINGSCCLERRGYF
jgi:hypothetical protein